MNILSRLNSEWAAMGRSSSWFLSDDSTDTLHIFTLDGDKAISVCFIETIHGWCWFSNAIYLSLTAEQDLRSIANNICSVLNSVY